MKIMCVAAALAVLVTVSACSDSGGSGASSSTTPTVPLVVAADTGQAVQSSTPTDACQIFEHFYNDLMTLTPHAVTKLVADLTDGPNNIVQAALAENNDTLYNDVVDLVQHVGAAGFAQNGTPLDPQIQKVSDDCS